MAQAARCAAAGKSAAQTPPGADALSGGTQSQERACNATLAPRRLKRSAENTESTRASGSRSTTVARSPPLGLADNHNFLDLRAAVDPWA